jgi:type 1 fimbriae regulatory protein FimB/type 1 fimbriae regulatory protein FimE
MQRQRVHEIVKRAGQGLAINVHAHVLRHSTGYALIKAQIPIRNVQSFLGHAAISSTLVYAHLDESRFAGAVAALA